MVIKTVQWNIGGGKLLTGEADPTLLRSYKRDGVAAIIKVLREIEPDIVTLQETHAANGQSQPELIAKALGYPGWVNDELADSHIEAGQRLGQGIVSHFPIVSHSFEWFKNPNFEVVWEDGSIARSHDKGRTRCVIEPAPGEPITVQTLHAIPFRRFEAPVTSEKARRVLSDMSAKLLCEGICITQGDFNVDAESLRDAMPVLFDTGFQEVSQSEATEVRGHRYDHVLYRGMKLVSSMTLRDVETDHYPVVTEFEVGSA